MAAANIALPLEPLIEKARMAADTPDGDGIFTDKEFAHMVGVSARTVARWRAAGNVLPWPTADEASTALGLHPLLVWGDEWLAIDADVIAGEMDAKTAKAIDRAMSTIGDFIAAERERGLQPA